MISLKRARRPSVAEQRTTRYPKEDSETVLPDGPGGADWDSGRAEFLGMTHLDDQPFRRSTTTIPPFLVRLVRDVYIMSKSRKS